MFAARRLLRPVSALSSSVTAPRAFSAATSDSTSLKSAFMRSVKGDRDSGNSSSKDTFDSSSSNSSSSSKPEPDSKKSPIVPPQSTPVAPPSAPKQATAPAMPVFTRRPAPMDANIQEFLPRICVIGVGGAGCNAVNNMIARGLQGVDFICANTDAQHLSTCLAEKKIQIGKSTTSGLGCGANPDVGRAAAEESKEELSKLIGDAHMVFITAGMGGGTGTGAAPAVAEICMEKKILTVAVVTKPFSFEGRHRSRLATEGLRALQDRTDTLIVIPNQNLFKLIDQSTSLLNAFALADDVLLAGVKSITDLMVRPGLINLDFADVQAVMSGMGNALMGTGQAEGENRAIKAASDALKNPLLGGDMSIKSAKGMLVNITGGEDVTLFEVDQAAQHVTNEIEDENANIIFGSSFDPSLQGSIRVSVVATGIAALPQ